MMRPTEKDLDRALEDAFRTNQQFTEWFLSRTKFRDEGARYFWSRSDHPWGRVRVPVFNPQTGNYETAVKEGETDVLVVLETKVKKRIAFHIENKLASGRFTPLQPEIYAARADAWKGRPNYRMYEDWETVLVAPVSFRKRFGAEAKKFDRFISHQDIAAYIPLFAPGT